MPYATAPDGVKLYYEECGVGRSVVFVHEYAGDYRSWEMQLRFLSRQYRCITFSQRGYPPSDVPADGAKYSQDIVRDDVKALMDELKIERAHIVGHSMGAYTTLHMGLHYAERCVSLTVAGCGWGSDPATRETSIALARDIARMFREEGITLAAAKYADFAMRQPHKAKDPRGDEDWACLDGSVLLKKTIPTAALLVIPRAGHSINSEEPGTFNEALLQFFGAVENRRWMAHRNMALDPDPAAK